MSAGFENADLNNFKLRDESSVLSPSLLFLHDRIEVNIDRMIGMVRHIHRLRPHVKTHKCPAIVKKMVAKGILKFKCATIAEAEMLAHNGATDILIAMPMVGPNRVRLVALVEGFSGIRFSTICDCEEGALALSRVFERVGKSISVFVDLDGGMHRTGIAVDSEAALLYERMSSMPGLNLAGLHVYDGHLGQTDIGARRVACDTLFEVVEAFRKRLENRSISVPSIVAGGTPSFPIHAQRSGYVECSPGTCVVWDHGYGTTFPDLDFLFAGLVFTRVISKPVSGHLCLDAGHKAVAAEGRPPHLFFPALPDAVQVMQSEEHLVIATEQAGAFEVGHGLYGVPRHICPTVALYDEAYWIESDRIAGEVAIMARARKLGF